MLSILDLFDKEVKSKLSLLQKQWIHNDLNEENLIIRNNNLTGFIDFGDVTRSYRIVDVSIYLYHFCLLVPRARYAEVIHYFLTGYVSVSQLTNSEFEMIGPLMLKRFLHCVAISEYNYKYIDPGNERILQNMIEFDPLLEFLLSVTGKQIIKGIIHSFPSNSKS